MAVEDDGNSEKSLVSFLLSIGLDEQTARDPINNNEATANLTAVIQEAAVTDGCDPATGNLLYKVFTKYPANALVHRPTLLKYIVDSKIKTPAQLEAAFEFFANTGSEEFSLTDFEELCNVASYSFDDLREMAPLSKRKRKKKSKQFMSLRTAGVDKDLTSNILDKRPITSIQFVRGDFDYYLNWEVEEFDVSGEEDWTVQVGAIRNQGTHNTCWTCASTDIVSAWVWINGFKNQFIPLSCRRLYFGIFPQGCNQAIQESKVDHWCKGHNREAGIKFIIDKGLPREDPQDFDGSWCCKVEKPYKYQIEQLPSKDMRLWETDDIQKMIHMLKSGPVTASLTIFTPDFKIAQDTKSTYFGPQTKESAYVCLHAVIIVKIRRIKGKQVAVVKSSSGDKDGHHGYAHVSLTSMVVSTRRQQPRQPTFLLTKFVSLRPLRIL